MNGLEKEKLTALRQRVHETRLKYNVSIYNAQTDIGIDPKNLPNIELISSEAYWEIVKDLTYIIPSEAFLGTGLFTTAYLKKTNKIYLVFGDYLPTITINDFATN